MYKNDIKRGDSYRFGEYAMAPELDLTSWYNAILTKMKQILQQIEDAGEGKKVNWIYGESFNDQPQNVILTYWDDKVNIPLTDNGSVICIGGTVDTESEEVILDGTSSLMELSNNQLNSIENNEVRISTQQAEQLIKLIKQLSGYHLPHSGYIPVQSA